LTACHRDSFTFSPFLKRTFVCVMVNPLPPVIICKHRERDAALVVEGVETLFFTLDTLIKISIRRPAILIEVFHDYPQHSGQTPE
jgi:hypothetical protein